MHLSAEVYKYGPLDSFSAFPFEIFLDAIKSFFKVDFELRDPRQETTVHDMRQETSTLSPAALFI